MHVGFPKDTLEAYSEAYAWSSLAKLSRRPGSHLKGRGQPFYLQVGLSLHF